MTHQPCPGAGGALTGKAKAHDAVDQSAKDSRTLMRYQGNKIGSRLSVVVVGEANGMVTIWWRQWKSLLDQRMEKAKQLEKFPCFS
jgi:hypothetical protein